MAQLTKVAFLSKYASLFADNSTRQISEEDLRDFREDISDSFLTIDDNFIDEDSFTSDSNTKAPSQQSVKAYVGSVLGSRTLRTRVTMTAANIRAISSTPFQLIAAPGANKMIQYLWASYTQTYGTTAFNFPATAQYGLKLNIEVSGGSFLHSVLNSTSDVYGLLSPKWHFQGAITGINVAINQPLTFQHITGAAGDATLGDSTGVWVIYYRIIDLA